MSIRRTQSLGTKLTVDEYAQCQALAGPQTMSAWTRAIVLRATRPDPSYRAVLAELIALRTILLNLHFAVASGHALTVDTMQTLIDRADQDKWIKADERLAAAAARERT